MAGLSSSWSDMCYQQKSTRMQNMTISSSLLVLVALAVVVFLQAHLADGFSTLNINNPTTTLRNDIFSSRHALKSQSNDNENKASDAIGGDLVTALAKLDKKWALAQKAGGGKKGEWTVLDVSQDETSLIVYLLEPSSGASPSCIIFFLGGAVLGQFPHISYSTFLQRLATKMNASVIAIPYEVGLDHFGLAQKAVQKMKNAVITCEDSRGYSESLPKYAIGHSLGAKLHAIGIAATGIGQELSGAGFISYNNFGFAETIRMSRTFAKKLNVRGFGAASSAMPFDALIDLAEMAVTAVGLEFTPSPTEMNRILTAKFDENVVTKTRMFVFDDDELDSCKGFLSCFEEGDAGLPTVSYLPGTHLTVSWSSLTQKSTHKF
jgi:hypothetical protein